MNLLKYITVSLLLLNLPTFFSKSIGTGVGGMLSLISFLLVPVYAIFRKKLIFLPSLIFLGVSYFLISGLQFYHGVESEYIERFLKYMLLIVVGTTLASDLKKEEMLIFLFIGAMSTIINATFFTDDYGRYSGLYLDPNAAGYICLTGFALSYSIKSEKIRTIIQFLFTFAGLITFSRTFIVSWLFINLLSLRINPKNIKILAIGAGVVVLTIATAQFLNLNAIRFKQLQSLVSNEEVSTQQLNEDSRSETWSTFYPFVIDKPISGNGYGSFQTNGLNKVGPHNTFLLVIGEAGIFSLIAVILVYAYLLRSGFAVFRKRPYLFFMSLAQVLFLLTNHNYFTAYYLIFISLWLFTESKKLVPDEN
ncbi:MAG: hypothetical protein CML04_11505 [Pseudozobellia sp.]|nr:hypothetical protein [Pseudozobellia sp.]MBG50374.1 hypothetical protein [Pseudozobellia sp.]|tara:strand:+ start:112964 stop:114055 length:1092 start_codon:yes stop_codon:yes gene_type:complete